MDASDDGAMSWMHPTYYPISEGLIRAGEYVGCMLADGGCALRAAVKASKVNSGRARVLQSAGHVPI
jgi:hypothetical protein